MTGDRIVQSHAHDSWWQRRLQVFRNDPSLGEAALSQRWWRYGIRRLRGFTIARGGGVALHVLETIVLARLGAPRTAILGFIVANLASLIAAAWWGATEVLRKFLRNSNDVAQQDAQVATWLAWSLRFASLVLLGAAALGVAVHTRPVLLGYCVAMVGRVALDLPLRVWHARVAARARVFRSPWIQVVVEAIGPLAVLTLRRTAGQWTVLISFVAASVASRAVTLYFVRRATTNHGYTWISPRLRTSRALPWLAIAGHAIAGIATRVPQIVGVAFLVARNLPNNIAIGMQLSIGSLSAATSWCWSHYHDLLPMQYLALARFRRRIERAVLLESVVIGIVIGALTIVLVGWMTPRHFVVAPNPEFAVLIPPTLPSPWPYAAAIPALALALSLLSAMQVIAWTRDHLGIVAVGGALAASAVAVAPRVAWWWHGGHGYMYDAPASWLRSQHVVLAVTMAVIALVTALLLRRLRRAPLRGRVAWLDGVVTARRAPTNITVLGMARGGDIAEHTGAACIAAGATWWARRERMMLVANLSRASIDAIIGTTGGWITSVRGWPDVERAASDSAMPSTRDDAVIFEIVGEKALPPAGKTMTRHDLTRIWRGVVATARGGAPADAIVGGMVYDGNEIERMVVRLRDQA